MAPMNIVVNLKCCLGLSLSDWHWHEGHSPTMHDGETYMVPVVALEFMPCHVIQIHVRYFHKKNQTNINFMLQRFDWWCCMKKYKSFETLNSNGSKWQWPNIWKTIFLILFIHFQCFRFGMTEEVLRAHKNRCLERLPNEGPEMHINHVFCHRIMLWIHVLELLKVHRPLLERLIIPGNVTCVRFPPQHWFRRKTRHYTFGKI